MPFISVIVPVYNVEKYITRCVESLTGQTLLVIEFICIILLNKEFVKGMLKIIFKIKTN